MKSSCPPPLRKFDRVTNLRGWKNPLHLLAGLGTVLATGLYLSEIAPALEHKVYAFRAQLAQSLKSSEKSWTSLLPSDPISFQGASEIDESLFFIGGEEGGEEEAIDQVNEENREREPDCYILDMGVEHCEEIGEGEIEILSKPEAQPLLSHLLGHSELDRECLEKPLFCLIQEEGYSEQEVCDDIAG